MKIFCFATIVLLSSAILASAHAARIPTVKEQLDELNKFWKVQDVNDAILNKEIYLDKEVTLIQLHLTLVEKKLRENPEDDLSSEQLRNRIQCLDILRHYNTNGIFPKNPNLKSRTPFFIDKSGTACAVGQLIISTGYKVLAEQIAAENNNAFIEQLNGKYPGIKIWADKYGFTIDELAWIQPAYAICDTSCVLIADISQTSGTPPFSYLWHPSGQTSSTAVGLCPGTVYICNVIDALGDTVAPADCNIAFGAQLFIGTNSLIIPAATPLYIELSSTADEGSCNGTTTVNVTNGNSPFSFYWLPTAQTTQTATGLCQGTHQVYVSDMSGCLKMDSIVVASATIVNSVLANVSCSVTPNPFHDFVSVKVENPARERSIITIQTIFGQGIFKEAADHALIDASSLQNGIYFLGITTASGQTVQKIIKR